MVTTSAHQQQVHFWGCLLFASCMHCFLSVSATRPPLCSIQCLTCDLCLLPAHLPPHQATAPDITGVLQLEAHLGCTAELPLYLTASGSQPQPFTAEFTPDSPLNFDVQPCKGLLPPAAAEGGVHGAETPRGPAPLKVAFICKYV